MWLDIWKQKLGLWVLRTANAIGIVIGRFRGALCNDLRKSFRPPKGGAIEASASLSGTERGMKGDGMNWYLEVLRKYAVFSGRARRKEYWSFALFTMIFAIIATVLDNVLGLAIEGVWYGPIYILFLLAVFLPAVGVLVRRLHDVGYSGWFSFISLIPFIGGIWLLVLLCSDSMPGENQYGANPKA